MENTKGLGGDPMFFYISWWTYKLIIKQKTATPINI